MKQKKSIRVILGILVLIVVFAYKSGAPAGSSCAPMETHCATNGLCHSSSINTGSATYDISIMGGIPANGYVPGNTYSMMPWIIDTSKVLFGFQIVTQKSDGTNAGAVTISSPLKTKLIQGNGLDYIEQTSAGASLNGMHDWMYDWTAPAAGSGKVTFYAAFVAANGNSLSSGDDVYIDSLVIQEKTTGINEAENLENKICLFPNPAGDFLNVNFSKMLTGSFKIKIIDMKGECISTETYQTLPASAALKINVSKLSNGIYFMQILNDEILFSINRFAKLQ